MQKRFTGLTKRSFALLVLFCVGCAAQSSPDLDRRIERHIRAYYDVPPTVQIKLGERKHSEFPNYDSLKIVFSNGTRTQENEFLVSTDGKTLVRMTKLDLSKDPFVENMSKINTTGRPVRGNANAKVTIVNYDDFQCPYCAQMHQTLTNDVLRQYGDRIKIVYKDFPLMEIHPWAKHAAVDSNCLAQQSGDAFWAFADYVHAHQREITGTQRPINEQFATLDQAALEQAQKFNVKADLLQACMKAQPDKTVRDSLQEAQSLGLNATPTLFINGEKLGGIVPPEVLHAMIDNALKDVGEKPGPNGTQNTGAQPANSQ